jgi:hypothetical protein
VLKIAVLPLSMYLCIEDIGFTSFYVFCAEDILLPLSMILCVEDIDFRKRENDILNTKIHRKR